LLCGCCILFGILLPGSISCSSVAAGGAATETRAGLPAVLWLEVMKSGFDVRTPEGLSNLVRMADSWIEVSEAQESRLTTDRKRMAEGSPLGEMPYEQLKKYFSSPPDYVTPKERRGLKEIKRWAAEALNHPSDARREQCLTEIFELGAAINNDCRKVIPEKLGFTQVPGLLQHYLHNPVGKGRVPANNLGESQGPDLSRSDPGQSVFWQPNPAIDSEDLFVGYGRSSAPDLTNCLWTYQGPKEGTGISPGFRAEAGNTRIKVKFAEIKSEPFTARIFYALGYHVDAVDYVPFLKIRYDRRFLRELHLRHDTPIPVTFFGLKLFEFRYQRPVDPFQFIGEAVLKDGSGISGPECRRRLYRNASAVYPEEDPANFHSEFEQQIDYLITRPASVQVRDHHIKAIGPWDFENLGHENLRELRGAGFLAAWVNWCDSQFQNTKLRVVKRKRGDPVYQYVFCDLGGGMGKGTGFFGRRLESPNDMAWRFTAPERSQGKGRMNVPFRVVGYKPVGDTPAFREMTVDDARWMARQIGQLTERQLLEALVASGFDSAETKLFLEKLINRRDQMILDLGLANEIALLRPTTLQRDWSYDPRVDGPIRVHTRSGQIVQAQVGDSVIVRSELMRRPSGAAGIQSVKNPSPTRMLSERD
jgi:hypothetical protein